MPLGRPCAKTRREPIEKLPGEGDLRQEHQSLPFLPQSLGDRLEINFRLARSRHALEQSGRERAIPHEADEIVGREALIGVEVGRTEIRIERSCGRLWRERHRLKRAVRDEAVDDAGRAGRARGQRSLGRWRGHFGKRRQDTRPRFRHARRRLASGDKAELRRGRLGCLAGADRHAQEHAARRQCPARCPVDEVAQRGAERRPVEDRGDGFQVVAAGGARPPHHPGRHARAERHANEGAGFELEA